MTLLALRAVLQVGGFDPVDDPPVLAGACTVDRDPAEFGFLVGARRLRHERREVAPLGHQFDLLGADVGLPRALTYVDERRFGDDANGLGDALRREREVDLLHLAEADADRVLVAWREVVEGGGDDVIARGDGREAVGSGFVRRRRQHGAVGGAGFYSYAGQNSARCVPDDAFDGASLFLGRRPARLSAESPSVRLVCVFALLVHPSCVVVSKRRQCR